MKYFYNVFQPNILIMASRMYVEIQREILLSNNFNALSQSLEFVMILNITEITRSLFGLGKPGVIICLQYFQWYCKCSSYSQCEYFLQLITINYFLLRSSITRSKEFIDPFARAAFHMSSADVFGQRGLEEERC